MPHSDGHDNNISTFSLSRDARPIFLAWEMLRIPFNLIVCLVTLFMVGQRGWSDLHFWWDAAMGAILANLLYFAGPLTETYIHWLGYRKTWIRGVFFVLGTLLTSILALAMIFTYTLPDQ